MPIIVSVVYRVKAGRRDELLSFVMDNVKSTRMEPGNIAYSHYPSIEDEQEMFVFEMWQDMKSLSDHLETDHYMRFSNRRMPMLESYRFQVFDGQMRREGSKAPLAE